MNMPKDKIVVLLQPYSYDPNEAFDRAVKMVTFLRNQGYFVFSPILHTHHFALHSLIYDQDFYYEWDFKLYDALRDKAFFLFTPDWEVSKGCRMEMEYVKKNNLPYEIIDFPEYPWRMTTGVIHNGC